MTAFTVGGKSPASAPVSPVVDTDALAQRSLELGRRVWAKSHVRAELLAIDLVATLGELGAKARRQADWLEANPDDPLAPERRAKHADTLRELDAQRRAAGRQIVATIHQWGVMPGVVQRLIHLDAPGVGLMAFVHATKAAALDPTLDAPMTYPTQERRGLALLLDATPDEWPTGISE